MGRLGPCRQYTRERPSVSPAWAFILFHCLHTIYVCERNQPSPRLKPELLDIDTYRLDRPSTFFHLDLMRIKPGLEILQLPHTSYHNLHGSHKYSRSKEQSTGLVNRYLCLSGRDPADLLLMAPERCG